MKGLRAITLVRLTAELLWSCGTHRLADCGLGSAGMAGFANAIGLCAKLETLEYVRGPAYLGKRRGTHPRKGPNPRPSFPPSPLFRHLLTAVFPRIGMNQIGNEGAQALAAMLSKCPVLKAIEYGGPFVILAHVADVLTRHCCTLALHRLDENAIGDAGVAALMAALPTCPSLEDVKSVHPRRALRYRCRFF